eukprot:761252-Hanusia_phi.AAC.2
MDSTPSANRVPPSLTRRILSHVARMLRSSGSLFSASAAASAARSSLPRTDSASGVGAGGVGADTGAGAGVGQFRFSCIFLNISCARVRAPRVCTKEPLPPAAGAPAEPEERRGCQTRREGRRAADCRGGGRERKGKGMEEVGGREGQEEEGERAEGERGGKGNK